MQHVLVLLLLYVFHSSDKNSFAYPTMKDRVPVIICKVVDLLYRDRASLNLSQPNDLKGMSMM